MKPRQHQPQHTENTRPNTQRKAHKIAQAHRHTQTHTHPHKHTTHTNTLPPPKQHNTTPTLTIPRARATASLPTEGGTGAQCLAREDVRIARAIVVGGEPVAAFRYIYDVRLRHTKQRKHIGHMDAGGSCMGVGPARPSHKARAANGQSPDVPTPHATIKQRAHEWSAANTARHPHTAA